MAQNETDETDKTLVCRTWIFIFLFMTKFLSDIINKSTTVVAVENLMEGLLKCYIQHTNILCRLNKF
jgi:hypothetical protein